MKHFIFYFISLILICSCADLGSPDPDDPTTEPTDVKYKFVEVTTDKSSCAVVVGIDGSVIYYRSNKDSSNPETYSLWRLDLESMNPELLLKFNTSRYGVGATSISFYDNELFFYNSVGFHTQMGLDLSASFPITFSSSSVVSDYITTYQSVSGGKGASSLTISDVGMAYWGVRQSVNGVTPVKHELRKSPLASLGGTSTNSAGEILVSCQNLSTYFSFSPDQSKLAFAMTSLDKPDGSGMDIYTLNLTTNELTQLTQSGSMVLYNNGPCWSPDNSEIAFYQYSRTTELSSVFTYSLSDGSIEQVTSDSMSEFEGEEKLNWTYPFYYYDGSLLLHKVSDGCIQIYNREEL